MEETFKIDHNKLKKEDREILMRYCFDRATHNSNSKLILISLFVALGSFVISVFGQVFNSHNAPLTIIVGIFGFLGMILFYSLFKKNQREIEKRENLYSNEFKKLFKTHFGYSFKEKSQVTEFRL